MGVDKNNILQMKSHVDKKISDFGSTIYHYTSIKSFISMLKTKQLWLSSTGSMNDKKEIISFVEMIEGELREYKRIDFFRKVYEEIPRKYQYAMSLSTERDDAAQWERYGDLARGLCIGFDVKKLEECLWDNKNIIFNRVYYDQNIINNENYKVVKNYFETGFCYPYSSEDEMIDLLIMSGHFHKHVSFKHECEIRILAKPQAIDNYQVKREIIELGEVLKAVIKLNLDKMGFEKGIDFQKLITEVIIGPRSQQNLEILKQYAYTNGYSNIIDHIIESKCPLR